MGYTEDLSRFVSQCGSTPLSQDVVDGAKRCFLDWIGVTLGAASESPVMILLNTVQGLGGKKQASIFGHRIKTSMVYAALVNGTMAETEAVVSVLMKDGHRYSSHVTAPKGNPENPMSFSELEAKVRDLTKKVLSRGVINRMIGVVATLEKLENTAELIRLCCPRGVRSAAGLTTR